MCASLVTCEDLADVDLAHSDAEKAQAGVVVDDTEVVCALAGHKQVAWWAASGQGRRTGVRLQALCSLGIAQHASCSHLHPQQPSTLACIT